MWKAAVRLSRCTSRAPLTLGRRIENQKCPACSAVPLRSASLEAADLKPLHIVSEDAWQGYEQVIASGASMAASTSRLLIGLRQSSTAIIGSDARMIEVLDALSNVPNNDKHIADALASSLCNALFIVHDNAPHLDKTFSIIERQPLSVLIELIRWLEADTAEATVKERIRKRLLLVTKQKVANVAEPSHLVAALYLCSAGAAYDELRDSAELSVLRLAEHMDGEALCRVLHQLALSGARRGPRLHSAQLLRAVTYYAANKRYLLSGTQLANAMYACAALSLYDARLLARLSEMATIALGRGTVPPAALASLSVSLGKLRCGSSVFLEALSLCYTKALSSMKSTSAAGLPLSCAQHSFAPSNCAELYGKVFERIADDPQLLLDTVWSLVVLGKHSNYDLSRVMKADVIKRIDELQTDNHKKVYNELKLLNVAFADAKSDGAAAVKSLQVLGHSVKDMSTVKTPPKDKSVALLEEDIITVLAFIAPRNTHQKQHVMTVTGHGIDIELLVDAKGQAKPLHDYADPSSRSTATTATTARLPAAPAGWRWVALKVLGFHDVLYNMEGTVGQGDDGTAHDHQVCKPIGRHQLAARQLMELGYAVVTIDFKEYATNWDTHKKLEFLRKKLASALNQPHV